MHRTKEEILKSLLKEQLEKEEVEFDKIDLLRNLIDEIFENDLEEITKKVRKYEEGE